MVPPSAGPVQHGKEILENRLATCRDMAVGGRRSPDHALVTNIVFLLASPSHDDGVKEDDPAQYVQGILAFVLPEISRVSSRFLLPESLNDVFFWDLEALARCDHPLVGEYPAEGPFSNSIALLGVPLPCFPSPSASGKWDREGLTCSARGLYPVRFRGLEISALVAVLTAKAVFQPSALWNGYFQDQLSKRQPEPDRSSRSWIRDRWRIEVAESAHGLDPVFLVR
jgi:hypothetical protein